MTPSELLQLEPQDIRDMSYSEFVGFVRETNRCPGGLRTVTQIANLTRLDAGHHVLEVGCTTGFTSLELASISRAHFTGIDISDHAIREANRRRQKYPDEIAKRVKFLHLSLFDAASQLHPFDVVVVGGATSFMQDKLAAINAYRTLVRPFGFLSFTNLFYHTPPPPDLIDAVTEIIGFKVEPMTDRDWLALFQLTGFEIYSVETHHLSPAQPARIASYVQAILEQPHLAILNYDTQAEIAHRLERMISVFDRNHHYLGYILVFMRNFPLQLQPELFFTQSDPRSGYQG